MNTSIIILVLLALTKSMEGSRQDWRPITGLSMEEVAGWDFDSTALTERGLTKMAIIPLFEYGLMPAGDTSRLVASKFVKDETVSVPNIATGGKMGIGKKDTEHVKFLFYLVLINRKVVATGTIRLVEEFSESEINKTLSQAESYLANTLSLSRNWKGPRDFLRVNSEPEETASIATITWPTDRGFIFDLDCYFMGSNGKAVGIYYKRTTFRFVVLEGVNSEIVVVHMGAPHNSRIYAFSDLEFYVTNRKALLIQNWESKFTPEIGHDLEILKLLLNREFGWTQKDFKIEMVKPVSNGNKGLIVIFKKTKSGDYVTITTMQVLPQNSMLIGREQIPTTMKISFVGSGSKDLGSAQSEIENYFTLAFSDAFAHSKDNWIWHWKLEIPTKKDMKTIEHQIVQDSLFPISGPIYFQKIREYGRQWIAIYENMGKLFFVIFQTSPELALIFSGVAGMVAEVHEALEQHIDLFPTNTNFGFHKGPDPNLPDVIGNDLKKIFDFVKDGLSEDFQDISKLGPGLIDPTLTKIVSAPFSRIKEIHAYLYCVAFRFTGDKPTLYTIVSLTRDQDVAKVTAVNHAPSTTADAIAGLNSKLRSEQLQVLIYPKPI